MHGKFFGWPLVKGVALTQPARWWLHSSKPPASLCCRTYSLVSRRGCPIPRRSENLFCSRSGSLKSNSFQKKLHFFLMFRSRNVIVALSYKQNEGCSMPRWVCDWMQMRYFVHQSRCFLGCGACIADLFYSLWSLSWFFKSVLTLIFFFRQLHLIATWPGVRWSLNASVHFAIPIIFIFMVIVFIWQLNTKFERGNDWLYWINLYCDSLMLEMIFHGQCWNQVGDVRVS